MDNKDIPKLSTDEAKQAATFVRGQLSKLLENSKDGMVNTFINGSKISDRFSGQLLKLSITRGEVSGSFDRYIDFGAKLYIYKEIFNGTNPWLLLTTFNFTFDSNNTRFSQITCHTNRKEDVKLKSAILYNAIQDHIKQIMSEDLPFHNPSKDTKYGSRERMIDVSPYNNAPTVPITIDDTNVTGGEEMVRLTIYYMTPSITLDKRFHFHVVANKALPNMSWEKCGEYDYCVEYHDDYEKKITFLYRTNKNELITTTDIHMSSTEVHIYTPDMITDSKIAKIIRDKWTNNTTGVMSNKISDIVNIAYHRNKKILSNNGNILVPFSDCGLSDDPLFIDITCYCCDSRPDAIAVVISWCDSIRSKDCDKHPITVIGGKLTPSGFELMNE